MKSSGSVLIVVLGLLAILAMIGITFVTMSNLDRRTAANFAVQSQFMLAADGAVDYVCHHLVQDLWAYNTMDSPEESGSTVGRHEFYSIGYLLSDHNKPTVLDTENVGLLRNEPFDYPDEEYDPWLSSPVDGTGALTGNRHFSYGYQRADRSATFDAPLGPYGLRDWGLDTDRQLRPNNLGFPAPAPGGGVTVPRYTYDIPGNTTGHGVWIPDLSFPFQTGLIRVSLTVLDHGGMVNVNAHGNAGDSARNGYYISDVDPSPVFGYPTGSIPASTLDSGSSPPGPWKSEAGPGNLAQKQVVIENPGRYGDRPFTLAEEFELRRLTGTYYTSRLEHWSNTLNSNPDAATIAGAGMRCHLTTVGWTAEIWPNYDPEAREQGDYTLLQEGYDRRKVDLNFDPVDRIKQAFEQLNLFDQDDRRDQFVANICAFRDGQEHEDEQNEDDTALLRDYGGRTGASRQPIFRKISADFHWQSNKDTDDDGQPDTTIQYWYITVGVYNPWRRLYLHAPREGLPLEDLAVEAEPGSNANIKESFGELEYANGDQWLPGGHYANDLTCYVRYQIDKPASDLTDEDRNLSNVIQAINLKYNGTTIDRINSDYIDQVGRDENGDPPVVGGSGPGNFTHAIERAVVIEGGENDPDETDVLTVYVFLARNEDGEAAWFEDGSAPAVDDVAAARAAGALPIRFPRSVNLDLHEDVPVEDIPVGGLPVENIPPGGLPPRWVDGISDNGTPGDPTDDAGFRAFPRVADLNQVLCQFPRPDADPDEPFWPWVPRVAAAIGEGETYHKFSWHRAPGDDAGKRLAAASIFVAGGPWNDRLDNDGDGFADATLPPAYQNEFLGTDVGRHFNARAMSQGVDTGGRFAGSEIRVAGKINLNTASRHVLEALGQSLGIDQLSATQNLANLVTKLRASAPIESPADLVDRRLLEARGITRINPPEDLAPGWVEAKDLPYALLSNIATVRSDTFSIYGTVQYIDVKAMHDAGNDVAARRAAVRRSRRFWALVDRSPCLCQNPTSGSVVASDFIRPRVLNFQWLD